MKQATLLSLPASVSGSSVDSVCEWIDSRENTLFVAENNWPEKYPETPQVAGKVFYTADAFYILFDVYEKELRVAVTADGGSIWEDSCVEFFIQPESDSGYYNYEFNAAGRMLLGYGYGREGRVAAAPEVLNQVLRYTQITGLLPRSAQGSGYHWKLFVKIPFQTLFQHRFIPRCGDVIRVNFYKCGDKLSEPHFLSWSPINTPSPDFHRPEFFGSLEFAARP